MQPINEWLAKPGGLAHQLRELRKGAGLDQSEVAEIIGTSQAGVSRIESGRRLPTAREVAAVGGAHRRVRRRSPGATG